MYDCGIVVDISNSVEDFTLKSGELRNGVGLTALVAVSINDCEIVADGMNFVEVVMFNAELFFEVTVNIRELDRSTET